MEKRKHHRWQVATHCRPNLPSVTNACSPRFIKETSCKEWRNSCIVECKWISLPLCFVDVTEFFIINIPSVATWARTHHCHGYYVAGCVSDPLSRWNYKNVVSEIRVLPLVIDTAISMYAKPRPPAVWRNQTSTIIQVNGFIRSFSLIHYTTFLILPRDA